MPAGARLKVPTDEEKKAIAAQVQLDLPGATEEETALKIAEREKLCLHKFLADVQWPLNVEDWDTKTTYSARDAFLQKGYADSLRTLVEQKALQVTACLTGLLQTAKDCRA